MNYRESREYADGIKKIIGTEIEKELEKDLILGIFTAISGMEAVLKMYGTPMANYEIVSSKGKSRYLDQVALNACRTAVIKVADQEGTAVDFRSEDNFDLKQNQGEMIGKNPSRVILVDQLDGTSNTGADPRGLPSAATVVCVSPVDKATYRGATVGVIAQPLAEGLTVYAGVRLEKEFGLSSSKRAR